MVVKMKNSISLVSSLILVLASFNSYSSDSNNQTPTTASTVDATGLQQFSQAELEQILAPIALYPDTILSHILVSATYPLEVIQAERWTVQNTNLEGSTAVEAVSDKDWDPSVKALVAFPNVLKRLSENLEWTQKLGDAFLQNEEKVLASVQSLRQRAYDEGSLDKMEKVSVTQENNAISIAPIEKEIVYVPYYDTRVVYGSWFWPSYPPVYWGAPYYAGYNPGYYSPFYWGPSVYINYGFHFSAFNWGGHHLVRIPYHNYNPHHYYSPHQIAGHRNVQPWVHNPSHRRGVSYRSVTVSNRYSARNTSQRASQAEVRTYRNNQSSSHSNNVVRNSNVIRNNSNNSSSSNTRNNRVTSSNHRENNIRIASPDRIREELRDGRITLQERNTRPSNHANNSSSSTTNRTNHTTLQPATTNRQNAQNSGSRGKPNVVPSQPQTNQRSSEPKPTYTFTPNTPTSHSNTSSSSSNSSRSSHSSSNRSSSSRSPSSSHSSRGSSSRSSGSRSSRSGHNR